MISISEALAIGMRHQEASQWAEAEQIYRQILAAEPDQLQALNQLGLLKMQVGDFTTAVGLFRRALRRAPTEAVFHAQLGEAYRNLGEPVQAEVCFREVLKLRPSLVLARVLLGVVLASQARHAEAADAFREALRAAPDDHGVRTQLGQALTALGELEEAEACFRRVANSSGPSAAAYLDLANCLHAQQKTEEAASCYRRVLEIAPREIDAHNGLAMLLKDQGSLVEALAHYLQVIEIKPDCALAHANLGAFYGACGRAEEAIASYRLALTLDSTLRFARYNLACLLERQGHYDEALACFEAVVRDDPNDAKAHLALGICLRGLGDSGRAIESYQQSIRLDPACAEAHNDLGVAWSDVGMHDEAIDCYRRALEIRPLYAQAHVNLGASLKQLGRLDEALVHYRRGIELEPDNADFHGSLLYLLNYLPTYDAATIFAEHRKWAIRHADPLLATSEPHANDRTPARRLRVGYVSPNFKAQAVNFFSEPILAAHDHAQFEVFCYSDVRRPDEITGRLRGHADHWRDTIRLSDEELSEQVRRDQIDILVDLTGHMGTGRRLLAFARKPAPVQVTYIGYQNTTGMLAMDYRLSDAYSDPPGMTEAFHTEKLVRLPRSFFCFLPADDTPPVGPLPAAANGYVTFGSVNNYNKVTPEVLKTWAELLLRVPGSRLVVRADMTAWLRSYLERTFAAHGVAAERLELVNRLAHREYLELIDRLDIALDPFPFNGHTTTCDCLWQGVPVVSLSGTTYASRFGGSALVTLGLADLIADTRERYLEIAAGLAADRDRLAELRATLRPRMAASPLLDFEGFTRNLEAEYRRMWRAWCES